MLFDAGWCWTAVILGLVGVAWGDFGIGWGWLMLVDVVWWWLVLVEDSLGLLGLVDVGVILENITVAVWLFSLPMSENMEVVVSGLSLGDMHFLWHKYVSNAGLQGVPKPKNVIILGMAASPKSTTRFCSLTGLRPPSKPQNCSLQRVSYDIQISKNGV